MAHSYFLLLNGWGRTISVITNFSTSNQSMTYKIISMLLTPNFKMFIQKYSSVT
jgi:hypothetical protein